MITLPGQAQKWTQKNDRDTVGTFWLDLNPLYASFNVDTTENVGKLRAGKRLIVNTNNSDESALNGVPVGFVPFFNSAGTFIYTAAGNGTGYAFKSTDNTLSTQGFTHITDSGAPSNVDSRYADIQKIFNELYIFGAVRSYYLGLTNSWSNINLSSITVAPQSGCAYGGRGYIAVPLGSGNGYSIVSFDSSHSLSTTPGTYCIDLSAILGNVSQSMVTFILAGKNKIWIGTLNLQGGDGYMYEWDGASTSVTTGYRLENCSGALSGVMKNDTPYITDSNGCVQSFNGGTFTKITQLYRKNNQMLYNALGITNDRFIHPRGMTITGEGRIQLLINGKNYNAQGNIEDTIPSGIYELNEETKSLIHKGSVSTAHASDTINDYGQIKIAGVGALTRVNIPSNASGRNGTTAIGASYYTDATTQAYGILYDDSNDTLQKGFSFITGKFEALDQQAQPSVQNMWDSFYTFYKPFKNVNDKIVVKYRTVENEPIEATITWTSSNSFTTTTIPTAYWTSGVGGEVEILQGVGAGKCAHITNIVNNAGTYTVTLDDTFIGASGTAIARFQSWIRVGTIVNNNQTFNSDTISVPSNWIQFKLWGLFTGKDEIEKLILTNPNTIPAK